MSLRFLLLVSFAPIVCSEDVVGPHVDVQVKVENSTTIHIKWDSHLHSILRCVLVVFVKGSKEDDIFLLPRNGSLKLTDRRTGTLYTISVNCFNGETILKSSNVSIDTGLESSFRPSTTPSTSRTKTQSTLGGHLNHAKLFSSDVLTGAVFGCIGGVILIYLSYSFYKKWRMDERLREFLRVRRNAEVAPYFVFGENEENAG
ncbi:uncharacterized protein [Scyliorhinus torazame]|uniref:uncharacterized protein n=1 Tax=Scyliorhinus torazame TaxID=75743 RepID=UPI003B5921A9